MEVRGHIGECRIEIGDVDELEWDYSVLDFGEEFVEFIERETAEAAAARTSSDYC